MWPKRGASAGRARGLEDNVQSTGHCSRRQTRPSRGTFSTPGLVSCRAYAPQAFSILTFQWLTQGFPFPASKWECLLRLTLMSVPLLYVVVVGGQAALLCGSWVVRARRDSCGPDGEVHTSPRESQLGLGTPQRLVLWTVLFGRGEWVLCVGDKNEIDVWWLEGKTKADTCHMLTNLTYFCSWVQRRFHFPFSCSVSLMHLIGIWTMECGQKCCGSPPGIVHRLCVITPSSLSSGNYGATVEKVSISR